MRIAIVGMGCRFAGAPDLHAYWQMTVDGRDGFGPVPADRWNHDAFFSDSKRATDKSYCPVGGFIQDIRTFPALHFGIPPRRVEVMDPQQRFTIEVGLQAIEDAGYRGYVVLEYEENGDPRKECPKFMDELRSAFA